MKELAPLSKVDETVLHAGVLLKNVISTLRDARNKNQIKPSAKLTYLSEDSLKVTLYRNNVFSLGYHSFDLYWRKMVDRHTGQFQFFNKNSRRKYNSLWD